MPEEIQLPPLGESVTSGIVTAWLVEVGDEVTQDQPIAEVSTDKVDMEIPSPVAGVITELRAEMDEEVSIGEVLAIVDPPGTAEPDAEEVPDGEEEVPDGEDESVRAGSASDNGERQAPAPRGVPAGERRKDTGGRQPDDDYDVVVVGAGTGGYSCALRAAQLGLEVALIERDKVGGTCLHRGCIPTKAILQTAEVAEHAREAGEFGVRVDYGGIDVGGMNGHKDAVVERMLRGLEGTLKGRGIEVLHGGGRLTDPRTVVIEGDEDQRRISAPAIVVATGSRPRAVPFVDFDGHRVINSDHALGLDELPASAIVLGSGAVGMEFATAWDAFGVEVTVVELLDRLLPTEDADASREIARQFRRRGISTMVDTRMSAVSVGDEAVTCTVETDSGEEELEAELLLVAVGRDPVTDGAGLAEVGVDTDEHGYVVVDDHCRTSVEGIWALGDVIPTLGLAHASFAEGFLVADQLAGLEVLPIDYRGVPRVTYCHPEVASVGYTEQEARDEGFEVVTERHPFQALGRAAMMRASGMIKMVAEADEDAEGGAGRVLGVHIVGPRATDLISEAELVYNWEALPSEVAQFIHPHPSLGEAMGEVSLALAGRALHG